MLNVSGLGQPALEDRPPSYSSLFALPIYYSPLQHKLSPTYTYTYQGHHLLIHPVCHWYRVGATRIFESTIISKYFWAKHKDDYHKTLSKLACQTGFFTIELEPSLHITGFQELNFGRFSLLSRLGDSGHRNLNIFVCVSSELKKSPALLNFDIGHVQTLQKTDGFS